MPETMKARPITADQMTIPELAASIAELDARRRVGDISDIQAMTDAAILAWDAASDGLPGVTITTASIIGEASDIARLQSETVVRETLGGIALQFRVALYPEQLLVMNVAPPQNEISRRGRQQGNFLMLTVPEGNSIANQGYTGSIIALQIPYGKAGHFYVPFSTPAIPSLDNRSAGLPTIFEQVTI